jgi:Tol biopolymer transport system component
MRRAVILAILLLAGGATAFAVWRVRREVPLPPGLRGNLIYLCDRTGADALYVKDLASGVERRLTFFTEAVRDPALSRDNRRVAFTVGGRAGFVDLTSGDVRILTFGIDWRDAAPSWSPDGAALVVAARRSGESASDLMLLKPLDPSGQATGRQSLVTTRGLDESEPVFTPDGRGIVFVREDNLFRVDLDGGRTRRLTGGFRKWRHPRFLQDGRLLGLWREEKLFGADAMDADGKQRAKLFEGTTYYSSLAPSPDARFFAATYAYDLRFDPVEAMLRTRHAEDLRLLDAKGVELAPLLRSWQIAYRSPQWAPEVVR